MSKINNIVNTYSTLIDESGKQIDGLFMLTVELKNIDEDGSFRAMSIGNMINATSPAVSFVIDENINEQLDNCLIKIIDNHYQLITKEGYEFRENIKTETAEERKIRELEEQLEELRNTQNKGEINYE